MQPHRRSRACKEFQQFPHAISLILALLKLLKCFWIAEKTLTCGSESFYTISETGELACFDLFKVSRHGNFESNFILTDVGIYFSCNRTTSLSNFCDVLYVNLQYLIILSIIYCSFGCRLWRQKVLHNYLSEQNSRSELSCRSNHPLFVRQLRQKTFSEVWDWSEC